MTIEDLGQKVVVDVGACRCPGAPHASDQVYLAPEASLTMGLRANGAVAKADNDPAQLELLLGLVFLHEGITGWTFVDEEGDEVSVTPEAIERLLPWGRGGSIVAEKANDLYGEAILAPLVTRSLSLSVPTPTNGSTSPIRPSRQTRRSSSKSSSRGHSVIPR